MKIIIHNYTHKDSVFLFENMAGIVELLPIDVKLNKPRGVIEIGDDVYIFRSGNIEKCAGLVTDILLADNSESKHYIRHKYVKLFYNSNAMADCLRDFITIRYIICEGDINGRLHTL